MKKTYTLPELQDRRGCYEQDQITTLWNGHGESVTLVQILESDISIKDKRWFLFNSAELSIDQKKQLALIAARVVLPIYEEKYPDDKRVSDCLDGVEKFLKGEISLDKLVQLRRAAYAAAADAYAAYAAADAADRLKTTTYSQGLCTAFIDFVNSNE